MKETRTLKPEQAIAAHTLDKHVSVTAGPGSGKTTVLVERYLHILREHANLNIDQIVAITFTNRAANEMRERLRKDLDAILATSNGPERQRWMRYKRTLDGAIINTIHGFCARLLREFPVEAEIDPQFLLLDQHDSAMLLEASVEETLTEFISKERELISQLALGFGRSKVVRGLVDLYRTVRGQGLRLDNLAQLTAASHSKHEGYGQLLDQLDEAMERFIGLRKLSPGAEAKRCFAERNWPRLRELLAEERPSLAEYCKTIESFRIGARANKSGAAALIIEQLDDLLWCASKDGFGLLPQTCFDLFASEFATEVIYILKAVERRYSSKKQDLAALDFDDLQLRALKVLENPSVLTRATNRYRFFLVDEFQDTNAVQRELMHTFTLSPAASRANLFIVGDRKQSIYGFRGADVDIFQQTTDALKSAGGIEQPLHLNFRSQPDLIKFYNFLFARLFSGSESVAPTDMKELGFVNFDPSSEQREQSDTPPLVELLIDTRSAGEKDPRAQRTAAERDARQVANRIITLTSRASQVESSEVEVKSEQRVEYRDIALLFRARTDVWAYEAVLRNSKIPFQVVQGKGFYERQEISDLIQLLRFLDNKTDELALAAVLRSPLGGVSDNALLALRCAPLLNEVGTERADRYFNKPRNLLYALRRHADIAYINPEDHAQLDRLESLLRQLIERRNHSPLADLLRFAVAESEYLTVIAANFDGAQKLANVQKLFSLAERFEHSGAHLIRDLVRYVEEFEEIGSREGEGQIDDSANAVRLMTIHQAKGLEFPIVIIPNLHHLSSKGQEYWFALDRYRGLTLKVPDGRGNQVSGCTLETFRERARLRESFESSRLLYVAATRAENRLILSGSVAEVQKLNSAPDSWLKLIWQKLDLTATQSGPVELEDGLNLSVTFNLADEVVMPSQPVADNTESEKILLSGSLASSFPILASVAPQPVGNHRFSVTQLINYSRCPRQYYFDRVLHVPVTDEIAIWNDAEAPEPPANLTATLKGAVIHRFCETYLEGEDLETRLRASFFDVIGNRRAQLADRLAEINSEEAIRELKPLAANYLSSSVFKRVRHLQKLAPDREAALPELRSGLWSELSFRLQRPMGTITGTIDKLLIHAAKDNQGFEVEIIDFKTNKFRNPTSSPAFQPPPTAIRSNRKTARVSLDQFAFNFSPSEDEASERLRQTPDSTPLAEEIRIAAHDYQLQMQAYALAVRQLMPELDSAKIKVTLHFLQPDVEFHLAEDLLNEDVCAAALDNTMMSIISATDPVQFQVNPATHCRICNFLEVCNSGRKWLRESRRQSSRENIAAKSA